MRTGRRATDAQVKALRKGLLRGASLTQAAMRAGMDRKTARKYRDQPELPSQQRPARTWRTRRDPLTAVWPRLQELLEGEPRLQAKTLLEWLQRELPEQPWHKARRTLERRVRRWKAQHGQAKEIYFAQVHEPGRLGASDFTHMTALGVTIAGQAFAHLVYHFVLTHSNWEHVTVCFSESFASLSAGLQNALWALGGVPQRHRTDRMTLAVHHEGQAEQYTAKYEGLLRHYGLQAEATNPASGHENGDCEQGHRRLKEAVEQALLLRGHRDFSSREAYGQFLRAVVAQRNAGRQERLAAELACLRPLPGQRLEAVERQRVKVGRGSTIRVKHNTYSVPARLIGETVEVRISAEQIEVCYAGASVQTMERLRGQDKHHIDYRHISGWLVRKPGAFARYVYREDLYPSVTYRRAYDALSAGALVRGDREYVRLLELATQEGEAKVEAALAALLSAGQLPTAAAVRACWGQETPQALAARVAVPAVDLRQYDALLDGVWLASSDSGLSLESPQEQEESHGHGRDEGAGAVPAGAVPAGDAGAVCECGAAGDGGDLELPGLPARAGAAGMSATAAAADRAAAEDVEAAAGEELAGAGPEAFAGEGGPATARAGERRLLGSAGERAGVRPAGLGQDARVVRDRAGIGTGGATRAVHELRPAGAGPVDGEARPDAQSVVETAGAVRGLADRRPGLCAAEPGGDGGAVHAAGGALRAGQRLGHEQPAVFEMGAGVQGPDDGGGGDRPAGASQRDRGVERAELPGGSGEESQGGAGRVIVAGEDAEAQPAKPAAGEPRPCWGRLIVAQEEG